MYAYCDLNTKNRYEFLATGNIFFPFPLLYVNENTRISIVTHISEISLKYSTNILHEKSVFLLKTTRGMYVRSTGVFFKVYYYSGYTHEKKKKNVFLSFIVIVLHFFFFLFQVNPGNSV